MATSKGRKSLKAYFAERRGLNQTQLAEKLGVEQPSVSAWVRGSSRPKEHYRRALERLVGIPADDWMSAKERAAFEGVEPIPQSSDSNTDAA